MKYLFILLTIGSASCNGIKNTGKMEGVYTAKIVSEFADVDDTLILRKANDGADIYQIQKHSGIKRRLDGRIFPIEFKGDTWTLDYNRDKQIFTELRQGRILIWEDRSQSLLLGNTHYRKIAD